MNNNHYEQRIHNLVYCVEVYNRDYDAIMYSRIFDNIFGLQNELDELCEAEWLCLVKVAVYYVTDCETKLVETYAIDAYDGFIELG